MICSLTYPTCPCKHVDIVGCDDSFALKSIKQTQHHSARIIRFEIKWQSSIRTFVDNRLIDNLLFVASLLIELFRAVAGLDGGSMIIETKRNSFSVSFYTLIIRSVFLD